MKHVYLDRLNLAEERDPLAFNICSSGLMKKIVHLDRYDSQSV